MKMYEKRRDVLAVLFAILLLSGVSAQAQPGGVVPDSLPELRLSLREAMEAAVDNNPNVRLL